MGSFVSGQVKDVYVDFNDAVTEGQLLAQIDPRTYEAIVARDKATLATAIADRKGSAVQLEQARREEGRELALAKEQQDYTFRELPWTK